MNSCVCYPLIRDGLNNTPLHHAARYGKLNIVKYFVEDLACDPSIKGMHGHSLATMASQVGHTDVVEYLFITCNCVPDTSIDVIEEIKPNLDDERHIPGLCSHINETRQILRKEECEEDQIASGHHFEEKIHTNNPNMHTSSFGTRRQEQ